MNSLFGSALRTDVLVAAARLSSTYPAELVRLLGRRLIEIQRALASLERSGALTTRLVGRTRLVELNRGFWASEELYALLLRLSELPEYQTVWASALRRRPRAIGKP